jgi:hypothetical protein
MADSGNILRWTDDSSSGDLDSNSDLGEAGVIKSLPKCKRQGCNNLVPEERLPDLFCCAQCAMIHCNVDMPASDAQQLAYYDPVAYARQQREQAKRRASGNNGGWVGLPWK